MSITLLYRRLLLAVLVFVLAACELFDRPPVAVTPTVLPVLSAAGAQRYRIDPTQSVIQLRVYRDGALARLGHNHVIVASQIQGNVYRREPMAASGFELAFPVAGLLVDRPADRRRAGADFADNVRSEAVQATRENMLGAKVLQADQYPTVELRSLSASGRAPRLTWRVVVRVRNRVVELDVPVDVRQSGEQLVVQGAVQLSQRALGLTPLCILAGRLCVRDTIDAEFYLVASPVAG